MCCVELQVQEMTMNEKLTMICLTFNKAEKSDKSIQTKGAGDHTAIKDHQQITFVMLNRFCPLSKKNPSCS